MSDIHNNMLSKVTGVRPTPKPRTSRSATYVYHSDNDEDSTEGRRLTARVYANNERVPQNGHRVNFPEEEHDSGIHYHKHPDRSYKYRVHSSVIPQGNHGMSLLRSQSGPDLQLDSLNKYICRSQNSPTTDMTQANKPDAGLYKPDAGIHNVRARSGISSDSRTENKRSHLLRYDMADILNSIQREMGLEQNEDTVFDEDIETREHPYNNAKAADNLSLNSAASDRTSFSLADKAKQKDVYLLPNVSICSNNDKSTGPELCAKLFGIVLYQYNPKSHQNGTERTMRDRKVIVQSVIPGLQADSSENIHRGDTLIAVKDVAISWLNLEEAFRTITQSNVVKLTFQSPVVIGGPELPITKLPQSQKPPPGGSLIKSILGDLQACSSLPQSRCTHMVMYLSLSKSETESDFVMYQYPREKHKLLDINGMFYTLSHMIQDVTDTRAKSSLLLHQDQSIHAAFRRHGEDVFVLALPADRVPECNVNSLVDDISRLVMLQYKSFDRAFNQKDNISRLDQFFSIFFHRILCSSELLDLGVTLNPLAQTLTNTLSGAPWINIIEDAKILADDILSDFESAEFEDAVEMDSPLPRRTYTILGSCVFYKGLLVCSHLPPPDLRDVFLFVKYRCLLLLSEMRLLDQTVIWEEVFPTRRNHDSSSLIPGYTEADGRWFLLIVGQKRGLMCVLLEAGGFSRSHDNGRMPKPPDLYIDQVKSTLLQMEAEDIWDACESRLQTVSGSPLLVSADCIVNKKNKDDLTPLKSHGSPKAQRSSKTGVSPSKYGGDMSGRPRSSPRGERRRPLSVGQELDWEFDNRMENNENTDVIQRYGSKLSYGSNDSAGSVGSHGAHKNKFSRLSSLLDLANISKSLMGLNEPDTYNTRAADSGLFHYLNFDVVEGLYIGPTQHEIDVHRGPIHSDLIANFHRCCLIMHQKFRESLQSDVLTSKFAAEKPLTVLKEQAVLFQYTGHIDQKKNLPTLSYWIMGRLFPPPKSRELYVCFHECVGQSLVDLAFKICSGCT